MKRSERGFTFIELLVVVAIVALIGGAASVATFQVITGTKRSNDHMTAIRQVQNAGYWISRDTLMAQSIVAVDNPETLELESITLYWTDWVDDEEQHKVVYTFHDMADGLKRLERQYLINGEEITTFVAERIVDSVSFSEEDGVWKLSIEASSGAATETREYEIDPRVNI